MAVQSVPSVETSQIWAQVLHSVRGRLGSPQAFDTWFKPIVPRAVSAKLVELEVPNAFFVDWIHEHHLSALRQSLTEVFGVAPEVRFSALGHRRRAGAAAGGRTGRGDDLRGDPRLPDAAGA